MVYFGSLSDDTLKTFTGKVNVNKSYTIENIKTSIYWQVNDLNGVLKAIPLFHTEEITSNNPNDVVLGSNKCVICEDKNTTLITCKGDVNPIIDSTIYILYAYTIDYSNIYCIITDKYNNLVKNVEITVYNDETIQANVKTNSNGICKYTATSAGSYYFKINNNESNIVVIE